MEQKIKAWLDINKKAEPFSYALFVIGFDNETDCPKNGKEYSNSILSYFYEELLKIYRDKKYVNLTNELYDNRNSISDIKIKRMIELAKRSLDRELKVPKKVLMRHINDTMEGGLLWQKAREDGDYKAFNAIFAKHLKYAFDYVNYNCPNHLNPYDFILDDFEDSFTVAKYDEFFNAIKEEIVPLVNQVIKQPKKYNEAIKKVIIPIDKQKKIAEYLMSVLYYDNSVRCIRETIHPFSNGIYNKDCRITVAYHEDNFISSIFSLLHEVGHALYNINHPDEFNFTNLFGGTSFGIHESQSRFYENYIGRSLSFCKTHFPVIQTITQPLLDQFTVLDFYYYINDVTAQTSRIEADELTYPLHVLIRYELEKALFNKEIHPKQAKKFFSDKMEEYLKIKPKNETDGVFQDSHYSAGAFGYFPTYALGSAYAAQFLAAMKKDLDFNALIEENRIDLITAYLKDKIHIHGALLTNSEVLKSATNEDFNPKYYIKYLKNKFGS